MPNGDSITPLTGIAVVRPDDLLDLTFEFRNLGLRRSGPPALVRVDPAASALVVVGFPPQSVGEGPSQGIEAGLPLPSALSDASRLAFVVNSAVTEIPFTLDGLLDWSRLTPSVAAEAIGVPPFLATLIEAPWRLVLTTGPRARWVSPRRAVTRGGVTELWCSRLDPGLPALDRVLRPLWSPDLLSPTTMRAALTVGDRQNIVTKGGGIPPNNATPVIARRLELSTRGAWMDVDGGWNELDPEIPGGLDISALGHDIDELFNHWTSDPLWQRPAKSTNIHLRAQTTRFVASTATCRCGRSVTSTSPRGSKADATPAPWPRCARSSTTR